MFFMFYILVTMKSCMLDIHCAMIQNDAFNREYNDKNPAVTSNKPSETTYAIGTMRYQTYIHNSKRSNSTYNLKSNIFDKMLSDEMLIIQQNLHRKDINQIPPLYISTGNNAPTPTLEVKQKWSVMNFLSNAMALNESYKLTATNKQDKNDDTINTINYKSETGDNYKEICCNNSRDKIVELRSLNDVTSDIVTSEYLENGRLCTCMNANAYTKCNHKCTAPKIQGLNGQENSQTLSNTDHLCSRTVSSQDTQPNIPFYITTEVYNYYTVTPYPVYYPWVIDVTKKKSKHRKNKKPPEHLDGIYYEDREEKNNQEDADYDDDIEKIKQNIVTDKDEENGEAKGKNVIINIEYQDKETLHDENSNVIDNILEQGEIQVSNKDEFTNQIVNDLKKYYNDVVIKDCYCSAANTLSLQCYVCIFWLLLIKL